MTDNVDKARNALDQKLADMGYEHPDSPGNRDNIYMSYSKDGDDPYVSHDVDQYATYTSHDLHDTENTNICPTCEEKAMYACDCEHKDMMCKNNHIWFVRTNGQVVKGDPHEDDA